MTSSGKRLTFPEIQSHPYFENVDWDNLRKQTPPIVPQVNSEIDTQNFDDFESEVETHVISLVISVIIVSISEGDAVCLQEPETDHKAAQDSFIGYTFKRYDNSKPKLADMFGPM